MPQFDLNLLNFQNIIIYVFCISYLFYLKEINVVFFFILKLPYLLNLNIFIFFFEKKIFIDSVSKNIVLITFIILWILSIYYTFFLIKFMYIFYLLLGFFYELLKRFFLFKYLMMFSVFKDLCSEIIGYIFSNNRCPVRSTAFIGELVFLKGIHLKGITNLNNNKHFLFINSRRSYSSLNKKDDFVKSDETECHLPIEIIENNSSFNKNIISTTLYTGNISIISIDKQEYNNYNNDNIDNSNNSNNSNNNSTDNSIHSDSINKFSYFIMYTKFIFFFFFYIIFFIFHYLIYKIFIIFFYINFFLIDLPIFKINTIYNKISSDDILANELISIKNLSLSHQCIVLIWLFFFVLPITIFFIFFFIFFNLFIYINCFFISLFSLYIKYFSNFNNTVNPLKYLKKLFIFLIFFIVFSILVPLFFPFLKLFYFFVCFFFIISFLIYRKKTNKILFSEHNNILSFFILLLTDVFRYRLSILIKNCSISLEDFYLLLLDCFLFFHINTVLLSIKNKILFFIYGQDYKNRSADIKSNHKINNLQKRNYTKKNLIPISKYLGSHSEIFNSSKDLSRQIISTSFENKKINTYNYIKKGIIFKSDYIDFHNNSKIKIISLSHFKFNISTNTLHVFAKHNNGLVYEYVSPIEKDNKIYFFLNDTQIIKLNIDWTTFKVDSYSIFKGVFLFDNFYAGIFKDPAFFKNLNSCFSQNMDNHPFFSYPYTGRNIITGEFENRQGIQMGTSKSTMSIHGDLFSKHFYKTNYKNVLHNLKYPFSYPIEKWIDIDPILFKNINFENHVDSLSFINNNKYILVTQNLLMNQLNSNKNITFTDVLTNKKYSFFMCGHFSKTLKENPQLVKHLSHNIDLRFKALSFFYENENFIIDSIYDNNKTPDKYDIIETSTQEIELVK